VLAERCYLRLNYIQPVDPIRTLGLGMPNLLIDSIKSLASVVVNKCSVLVLRDSSRGQRVRMPNTYTSSIIQQDSSF
jgi:hypothetical protein